ncbi:MAG: MBL fold metallo-hydrolase [Pyrinomonadaceae bacterium]|nr:MBL fold metallo-hydrolase [Pyrinomonadaceae bacterium]
MKTYKPFLRTSFSLTLFFAAVTTFTHYAAAQTTAPKLSQSQAGFYRMKVGDFEVVALSDGTVPLPVFDALTDIKQSEIERLLQNSYLKTPLDISVNAFLIKPADKTDKLILVDTGTGKLYGPTLNKLTDSLKAAGYEPEQITDILITHVHTDHSGGLTDGNRMIFPNTVIHLEKREVDYWLNPTNKDKSKGDKERLNNLFREANATFKPYLDVGRVKTFDGDTQLFAGIKSIAAPGHTPGHSFYAIESKGEKMIFCGDIMHFAEIQFPNPAATVVFDSDPNAAAMTRKKAFAEAAKNGYWLASAHVSFPGIGHLRTDGKGYKWIPTAFVNDAYKSEK